MEYPSPDSLTALVRDANADMAAIAAMLRYIRDQVAPTISEFDLNHVATRHSVRARISPHPTLRRATMAAEAAFAAMRGIQECVATASSLLLMDLKEASSTAIKAEASHWAYLAQEQIQAVARARAAIAAEIQRVAAGTATVMTLPPVER